MSLVNLLLNVLWVLTGGLWMAVGWLVAAAIMAITIVGLPWARAAFNIAAYALLPFGHLITAALLAVTLIGIPFAWAHLKMVPLSLWPIGKTIVDRA